jgi:hypothetical protein
VQLLQLRHRPFCLLTTSPSSSDEVVKSEPNRPAPAQICFRHLLRPGSTSFVRSYPWRRLARNREKLITRYPFGKRTKPRSATASSLASVALTFKRQFPHYRRPSTRSHSITNRALLSLFFGSPPPNSATEMISAKTCSTFVSRNRCSTSCANFCLLIVTLWLS